MICTYEQLQIISLMCMSAGVAQGTATIRGHWISPRLGLLAYILPHCYSESFAACIWQMGTCSVKLRSLLPLGKIITLLSGLHMRCQAEHMQALCDSS